MALRNISGSLKTRSDIEIVDPSFVGIFVLEDRIAQYFNVALVTALAYHSSRLAILSSSVSGLPYPYFSVTTMDKEVCCTRKLLLSTGTENKLLDKVFLGEGHCLTLVFFI